MNRRLRVSHVVTQVHFVWDDGEELTQGPEVAPQSLTLKGLASLVEGLPAQVAEMEAVLLADLADD